MNRYRIQFATRCPKNGIRVNQELLIEHKGVIDVELIVSAIEEIERSRPMYQEAIADLLSCKLPGKLTIKAHHHGVDITTERQ